LRSLRFLAVFAAGALAMALSMVFGGGRIVAGFGRGDAPALHRKPVVVDGDSPRTGARRIRLLHVDACETGQPATRGGYAFDGGGWARAAMVAPSRVACENYGLDRYGRVLAHCRTEDSVNIALAAVRAGIAFVSDPRRVPRVFTEAGNEARVLGLGVWDFTVARPGAYSRRSA